MAIDKRSNGSFRARYRDASGKEHARHFKRKTDARAWLDEVTAQTVTGMYVDPVMGKITFTDFYRSWSERQVWEATTRRGMDNTAKRVTFGDVPLAEIRRSHIEQWVKIMSTRYAASTIKTRMSNVRAVFHGAIADRFIAADPTIGVRTPKERKPEHVMRIPTPEEVRAIMEYAVDDRFRVFLALCAFAGLRKAEAGAVQMGDINFLRRELHVRRQTQRGDQGQQEVRLPKHGSERTVPVHEDLLALLSKADTFGREHWLWVGSTGRPACGNTVHWYWKRTRTAAGVSEEMKIHDLRHFYASGLIAQGCDVPTVQYALGHSSPAITLNTYTHLWPKAEDRTRAAAAGLWSQTFADNLRTSDGATYV